MTPAVLLSCEHGGNRVPARYRDWFATVRARRALNSHRGFDRGALDLARWLSRRLRAPLIYSTTTRLLADLNRSPSHPRLLSEFVQARDTNERARLLATKYHPYRQRVEGAIIERARARPPLLHVAVHSFAPRLAGQTRAVDVGLLYDPARHPEARLCRAWRHRIQELDPTLRVRLNYPYRGTTDGLTTAMRGRLPARRYWGVELEVNQRCLGRREQGIARVIAFALEQSIR